MAGSINYDNRPSHKLKKMVRDMKHSCFQTSGGHYSEFVAIQFRCCYVLCNFGRRLLKSDSIESLEFRKVVIFSCWEAEHTPGALYTGWERLEGMGGGETGETTGKQKFVRSLGEMCLPILQVGAGDLYKKRCGFCTGFLKTWQQQLVQECLLSMSTGRAWEKQP